MSLPEGAPARSGWGVKLEHPDVTTDDTASPHTKLPEVARRVFRKRPQGVSPDALRCGARRGRSVRVTGAPA